jgi:3-hydroxyisobutyrate dehydrogenase-like beta-hydroxyacid dehydrogenase
MAKIAFLGLGAMGSRMAANLIKAGHDVTVWNRSAEKGHPLVQAGARTADTPRAAAEGAEFAIGMVRDDAASREIWLDPERGALQSLPSSAVGIESSTVTVAWAKALGAEFHKRSVSFIDAPVSGSRPQAEAAQLTFLVGGDNAAFAKAEPVLKRMGSTIQHAGPIGSGATVKLAINALLGIQIAAMGELIGFLKASGADLAKAIEILTATHVCSTAAKTAANGMMAGTFAPLFPAELMEKDLGYIRATADAAHARIPVTDSARDVFRNAIAQGHAQENMTSVVKLYL